MQQADIACHCRLESWHMAPKAWVADPTRHESIAAAMAAATERGVYRVVLVNGDRSLEVEVFAVV